MYGVDKKKHEEIYNILADLFKVKFKSQVNNSPLQFRNFFQVRDLLNKNEFYSLALTRTESIVFTDRESFIEELIKYLSLKIKELESEQEYLDNLDFGGIKYDENDLHNRYETIGWGLDKYPKIIKQLLKYKSK